MYKEKEEFKNLEELDLEDELVDDVSTLQDGRISGMSSFSIDDEDEEDEDEGDKDEPEEKDDEDEEDEDEDDEQYDDEEYEQ